jgi:CHASE3 domain sensor protein
MPRRALVGAFSGGAALLVLLSIHMVLMAQWGRIHEEQERQARIKEQVLKLERLVTDVDNGFRGYVLVKQSVFLAPMNAAEENVPRVIEELRQLTDSLPDLQGVVLVLRDRINELLEMKRRLTLELERGGEVEVVAYIRGGEGLALANTIALLSQDLKRRLEQREERQKQETANRLTFLQWGTTLTVVAGCAVGIGVGHRLCTGGRPCEPVRAQGLHEKGAVVRPGDTV